MELHECTIGAVVISNNGEFIGHIMGFATTAKKENFVTMAEYASATYHPDNVLLKVMWPSGKHSEVELSKMNLMHTRKE